ncbi:MAG: hypothetical protein NC187_02735 [Candidatus Amulumruptor caecigallinarius]|nr:hypothetical protein [Candidatus Amulumruptor caecigallinarius]MCM1396391.1 hypothetical protein [Candidatus Amulumruptor caecigallinarius]MCM1453552.1 hypothetical protein [bacterium]
MIKDSFIDSLAPLGHAADGLPEALMTPPEVSIRINPAKPPLSLPAQADGNVPWHPSGRYLATRPTFTLDPALHQGRYYVQDASSMFVAEAVRQLIAGDDAPLLVLDACAAPGGKSTAVADMLPPGSVLVSNEIVPARAASLRENVIKWGFPGAIVTRGDAQALVRSGLRFDIIIADVPCSGEGMMRKEPEAAAQWSPGLVVECAALQSEIVTALWQALRPGGTMIYSTCTFNLHEDEEQLLHAASDLGAVSVPLAVEPSWGIFPSLDPAVHALRFFPGRVRGEGLFMGALRKPGDAPHSLSTLSARSTKRNAKTAKAAKGSSTDPASREALARAAEWVCPELSVLSLTDGRINASTPQAAAVANALKGFTDVIYEAVAVAILKGRDIIPLQSLAMSTALRPDAFPRVEVSRADAIAYLRRDSLTLPADTPRGLVLLTFEGMPLGFAKHLGNRTNNLYPPEWRILMRP